MCWWPPHKYCERAQSWLLGAHEEMVSRQETMGSAECSRHRAGRKQDNYVSHHPLLFVHTFQQLRVWGRACIMRLHATDILVGAVEGLCSRNSLFCSELNFVPFQWPQNLSKRICSRNFKTTLPKVPCKAARRELVKS